MNEGPKPRKRTKKRWVIICTDGSYATLKTASRSQVRGVEEYLRQHGRSGWLAAVEDYPPATNGVALLAAQPLADPKIMFPRVAAAFLRALTTADELFAAPEFPTLVNLPGWYLRNDDSSET